MAEDTNALTLTDDELLDIIQATIYPGANLESCKLALHYCKAKGLDPLAKMVHIVPMPFYDQKKRTTVWRDVILPGIDMYRVRASRTGQHVGTSEPEWGPETEMDFEGQKVTVPQWCRVTVSRFVAGQDREFVGLERWDEACALTKGKPNRMWLKRRFGQLAKCAESQALRKAFPEETAGPTAEEMIGKSFDDDSVIEGQVVEAPPAPKRKTRAKVLKPQDSTALPDPGYDKAADEAEAAETAAMEPVPDSIPAAPKKKAEKKTEPPPDPPSERLITEGQAVVLRKRLSELNIEEQDLVLAMEVESIEKLPSNWINRALKWLKEQPVPA